MSEKIEIGGAGKYQTFADIVDFFNRKRREVKKGVSLYLDKGKYISCRFNEPGTGKRKSKPINEALTEVGVIKAVEKGNKIVTLLNTVQSTSEFWERYDKEVEQKVEAVDDIKTYQQIFKEIEDEFWNTPNKQTKRKRDRSCPSDVNSFESYYGKTFLQFEKIDKIPAWEDFKHVFSKYRQGTKTYRDTYFVLKNVAKRCHNSEALLKQLDQVKYHQTERFEKQSISLEAFMNWREEA
jgi:hypothetical protein